MALDKNLSQTQAEVFIWVSLGVCLVMTTLRGTIRWNQQKRLYSDDYWSFAAAILLFITALHIHWMIPGLYESQRMTEKVPMTMSQEKALEKLVLYLKLQVSVMNTFWGALWAVKISFMMLIKRLFLTHQAEYRKWWWAVFIYVVATYIGEVLINLLACIPLPRRWSLDPLETCGNEESGLIAQGIAVAFDISSDLSIMIMPLRILSGLHVTKGKRLGVQAMFALSIVIIIVAALRCAYTTTSGAETFDQPLWLVWTWAEAWVATIIVNIPVFKRHLEIIWEHASSIKSTFLSRSGMTNSNLTPNDLTLDPLSIRGKPHSMDSEVGLVSQVFPTDERKNQSYQVDGKIVVESDIRVTSGQRRNISEPAQAHHAR